MTPPPRIPWPRARAVDAQDILGRIAARWGDDPDEVLKRVNYAIDLSIPIWAEETTPKRSEHLDTLYIARGTVIFHIQMLNLLATLGYMTPEEQDAAGAIVAAHREDGRRHYDWTWAASQAADAIMTMLYEAAVDGNLEHEETPGESDEPF